ncbi:hypothetical protein GCM10027425_03270 [Alteromonas gracilis]
MSEPVRVLFVCTANICRSAYAEVYARDLLRRTPLGVEVRSAGTHGFDAAPMDPPMAARLAERGVAADDFRSHRLGRDDVAWADVIVTMESSHRRFVLEDHPTAAARTFTLGQLAARADDLGDGARGRDLVALAHRRRGRERRTEDVGDPYRRGETAAQEAADRISGLVERVLPALSDG